MVKTHRRYQEVAARISRYIAEKGLEPGARLPGEIDLAKICGVSRPTIREAMVSLEIAGELEIRSGSGAYVREAVNPMSLILDSGPGPFELLRARMLIEGEISADAALYASAGDLAKIEKTLQQMRRLVLSKTNAQVADRRQRTASSPASSTACGPACSPPCITVSASGPDLTSTRPPPLRTTRPSLPPSQSAIPMRPVAPCVATCSMWKSTSPATTSPQSRLRGSRTMSRCQPKQTQAAAYFANNWLRSSNALNSSAFPAGSRKNIVDCSPTSPSNRV